MTPPLSPPLAVHHPVSTHHRSYEIQTSLPSVEVPFTHRGGSPVARTLGDEEKGCVRSEICGSNVEGDGGGGCGGGNDGCCSCNDGGGVVAAPNLAVTFSVGTTQEQQQGSQQHVDSRAAARTERITPRPPSIESVDTIEGGVSDNSREASSYVWRVLVYLAFINPFLCLLCSLYSILVLLAVLITYPIRSFFLSKDNTYSTTPGLPYLLLLHMRLIYPQPSNPPHSILPLPDDFDPIRLILVHLFGPFLAGIIATASWILVFVWIYTEVLLGEKNDGRGAEYRGVMFVKRRWEEYILIALKPKSLDGY